MFRPPRTQQVLEYSIGTASSASLDDTGSEHTSGTLSGGGSGASDDDVAVGSTAEGAGESSESGSLSSEGSVDGSGSGSEGLTVCKELVSVLELGGMSAFIAIEEEEPLTFSTRWVGVICTVLV